MEVVLADDLTGAAEIAGIAWRSGRSVELCLSLPPEFAAEVTVLDTDTRLLAPGEAAERIRRISRAIRERGATRVFKKVDSVLRGSVAAEVEAALDGLGRERAVLLSANPSRGRVVRGGVYFVDGLPLAETPFAEDPFHPVEESRVRERIGATSRIVTPDAETADGLEKCMASLDLETLPVGASDFYRAWSGGREVRSPDFSMRGKLLWIGGSQAIRSQRESAFWRAGIPVVEGGGTDDVESWVSEVVSRFEESDQAAMEISKEVAVDASVLLDRVTRAGEQIVGSVALTGVCVEGGATARSLIDRVGGSAFRVVREWAPGVVGLRRAASGHDEGIEWILKPGSYAWPEVLYRRLPRNDQG